MSGRIAQFVEDLYSQLLAKIIDLNLIGGFLTNFNFFPN